MRRGRDNGGSRCRPPSTCRERGSSAVAQAYPVLMALFLNSEFSKKLP
jgi:hypothetical protein